jgi:hypothetical protein
MIYSTRSDFYQSFLSNKQGPKGEKKAAPSLPSAPEAAQADSMETD